MSDSVSDISIRTIVVLMNATKILSGNGVLSSTTYIKRKQYFVVECTFIDGMDVKLQCYC